MKHIIFYLKIEKGYKSNIKENYKKILNLMMPIIPHFALNV